MILCHLSFKSFFWQFQQRRKNNAINYEKSIQHTVPLEIQTRTLEHLEKGDDEIAFYE